MVIHLEGLKTSLIFIIMGKYVMSEQVNSINVKIFRNSVDKELIIY